MNTPRKYHPKTYFQQNLSVLQPKSFGSDQYRLLFSSDRFIASASLFLERNVKTAVENCFSCVVSRVIHVI